MSTYQACGDTLTLAEVTAEIKRLPAPPQSLKVAAS